MRYTRIISFMFASLLLAAGARAEDSSPAAVTRDKPVRCLTLSAIRNMSVIDRNTLLFEMPGHKYYVNKMSFPCARLDGNNPIMYRTHIDMLCNLDTVTVMIPIGGGFEQGPACGLGMFSPVSQEEAKKLLRKH